MLSKSAALLFCLAAVAPLAARADSVPDAAQKAVDTAYKLQCSAYLDPTDANMNSVFALLAPDFVDIRPSGEKTPRDQYIAKAKQNMKGLVISSCDNSIVSTSATDANTVVVVVTGKAVGTIQAPDGKHDVDASGKSQDTWKNVNGAWLETESKTITSLVKIDGKVVVDEGN